MDMRKLPKQVQINRNMRCIETGMGLGFEEYDAND